MDPRSAARRGSAAWWSIAPVAVAVLLAALAAADFDAANVDNDVAQHLSTAQNLLDGHGFSTSLLFYDEHYVQDRIPAVQTVWPPGHALLIAALLAFDVPPFVAILLIGIVAHVLGVALLYRIGRIVGLAPWLAALPALAWAACTTELGLIVRGHTEPLFVAVTLAAAWAGALANAAADPKRRSLLLLAGGAAAAAAFLLRYAGIAFIGAFVSGTLVISYVVERRMWPALRDTLSAAVIPLLMGGGLAVRNWLISSTLTGWPQVENEAHLWSSLRAFYWAAQDVVGGASGAGDLVGYAIQLVLFAGVAAVLVRLAWSGGAYRAARPAGAHVVAVALLYCAATFVLLVMIVGTRDPELLNWRYLVPLMPFGLLAVAVWYDALWKSLGSGPRARFAVAGAAGLWLVALAAGQVRTIGLVLENAWLEVRAEALRGALAQRVGDDSLRELLERDVSLASPLLSNEGQGLGGLLGRPTLSLSPSTFSNRVWDEPTVQDLVERYCVRWVVFIPSLFDEQRQVNANRGFFVSLARREPPEWLVSTSVSEHAHVYRTTLPCRSAG